MDEKKSITQDLLSFDLDSVVEEGKKKERKSRNKKIAAIAVGSVVCLAVILGIVYTKVIAPQNQYNDAVALSEQGEYQQAIDGFSELGEYKDSADIVLQTKYTWAESLLAEKAYDEAYAKFEEIKDYLDAASRMNDVRYAEAEECLAYKDFDDAYSLFNALGSFKNAEARTAEVNYLWAEEYLAEDNLEKALELFTEAGNYGDAKTRADEVFEMMQIHATVVKLSKTSLTINKGKTAELTATLEPADTTDTIVSWTSSDEKVAKVDENGVVTAVGYGTATIEVKTSNELIANCKVTVPEPAPEPAKGSTGTEAGVSKSDGVSSNSPFHGSWEEYQLNASGQIVGYRSPLITHIDINMKGVWYTDRNGKNQTAELVFDITSISNTQILVTLKGVDARPDTYELLSSGDLFLINSAGDYRLLKKESDDPWYKCVKQQ